MSKFNIGDKVVPKGYPNLGEEVGVVVGIDTKRDIENKEYGVYLVKFDSLDERNGWEYELFSNNPNYIVKPYEGYAIWLEKEDLTKVEEESEEECEEDKHEEDIKMEFDKIREQKKEVIKEMTLKIKELEAEIEKIKKEWCLN